MASPLSNKTALHLACEYGHTNVMVALLNNLPALLMIDDSAGETSLHIAARKGYNVIMKNFLLIAEQTEVLKSPNCNRLEEAEMDTVEPAYLYDSDNHAHVMNETLPEIEVDVMAKSGSDQRTPLHEAAIAGHAEIVQLLVDYLRINNLSPRLSRSLSTAGRGGAGGANNGRSPHQSNLDDPEFKRHVMQSNTRPAKPIGGEVPGIDLSTLKGRTAFHEASRHGHFNVMEILLKAGADINAFMNIDLDRTINTDLTALVQACLMDQLETVRFLLRHGAKDARLKALSRSLKGSLHDVAGILLCYNNHIREVSQEVRKAMGLSMEPDITYLQIMWNSKNLKFICADWLELTTREFPKAVSSGHFCAIAQLDLSSNEIVELPREVFKLQSLINLDISRNQVDFLPYDEDKFLGGWKCTKLACFECVRNNITLLPSCLFRLSELREVNACSNKISVVPPNVWTAPKLKRLYLASNCLEGFPSPKQVLEVEEVMWNQSSDSPAHTGSFSPGSPNDSTISDSGYKSDIHPSQADAVNYDNSRRMSMERKISLRTDGNPTCAFPIPHGPVNARSKLSVLDRDPSHSVLTQAVVSRRLESFQDGATEVEELEELHEASLEEGEEDIFPLEVLDLSNNRLAVIPSDLSCLTPKLTKLNVSKNRIKSLGNINDYPIDLEFLDASNNLLHTAIAPALSFADRRYSVPYCIRKAISAPPLASTSSDSLVMASPGSVEPTSLIGTPSSPSYMGKLCNHRLHKNLRKLSTVKLNYNHLIDLQLFRTVNKNVSRTITELGSSLEEMSKSRAQTTNDPFAVVINTRQKQEISKSMGSSVLYTRSSNLATSRSVFTNGDLQPPKGPGTSPSGGGSQEEPDGVLPSPGGAVVISPLYPTLATLELASNSLKSVPSNIHHISSLSCLMINHNPDIDTLPLELSNLDHLWNLEYEGCPLTNPPKDDLDKFRLASDKLLYMRSLLHE